MENSNNRQLSFPQRNWLLLCIIVAILSPFVVHWVHIAARKRVYHQATEIRDTANKGAADSASGSGDTSNRVASPPSDKPAGATK